LEEAGAGTSAAGEGTANVGESSAKEEEQKIDKKYLDLPQQPYCPLASRKSAPFCVNVVGRIADAEYLGVKDIP
jgi:hypothetical protein